MLDPGLDLEDRGGSILIVALLIKFASKLLEIVAIPVFDLERSERLGDRFGIL